MPTNNQEPTWRDSSAKAYLQGLIKSNQIPGDMQPKAVYAAFCEGREEFRAFGNKNFSSRLRSLRKAKEVGGTAGSKKEVKWRDSPAKAYLEGLLKKGKVPAEMGAHEVYQTFCKHHMEFELFEDQQSFSRRLKSLRDAVSKKNGQAERDAQALNHDRMIYGRPHQDGHGLPYWPDCDAKDLLEEDIEDNKHNTMTKAKLWKSRPEYHECFPFDVFVGHVHSEVRSAKFHAYLEDKAEKKIDKKYLKNIPSNTKEQ